MMRIELASIEFLPIGEQGAQMHVLLGPHQHVVHVRARIDQVDWAAAFLLDGLP